MSGLTAIEGELNGAIQEYFEYIGFDSSLEKFNDECTAKGKPIANSGKKSKSTQKINVILDEMVQLFLNGQRKEFFRQWLHNIPESLLNDDLATQRLEFELNIHFAIFPFRKGGKDMKAQAEESMNYFKAFIENRGRVLSQTTEFLPYFALPYVPNPLINQGYQEIFTDTWMNDLKMKLENFVMQILKLSQQSRLVEAYSSYLTKDSSNVKQYLEKQLLEADKRVKVFQKKFNKCQSDYHNLIGITAELVDSLENTIMGQPVTSEYLQNICNRLFNNQTKQSIDFSRPGTAGEYIRQSLAYHKTNVGQERKLFSEYLDYDKIKYDLCNSNNRHKALILQALRWSLTKTMATDRDNNLDSFIRNNLLSLNSDNRYQIIDLLKSGDETIRQYMARLLNSFASLNKGRSYLACNSTLVTTIHSILRNEQGDTLCMQNLLAVLQKLSLRRNFQLLMINDNLIAWLIELLMDTEALSDYTVEYAVALLMNLCLRSCGRNKCELDHKRTLKVLSDLLGNPNHQILPYVNGTLYSVLCVPAIREHAKAIHLEEILKGYLNERSPEINTQIQFIIKQINSNDEQNPFESDDEDDNDDDDDDEEDQDVMEADLDKAETIKAANNELSGDSLLINDYLLNTDFDKNKNKSGINLMNDLKILSRPTTPYQLKQSMFQINQIYSVNFDENETPNQSIIAAKRTSHKPQVLKINDRSIDQVQKSINDNLRKNSSPVAQRSMNTSSARNSILKERTDSYLKQKHDYHHPEKIQTSEKKPPTTTSLNQSRAQTTSQTSAKSIIKTQSIEFIDKNDKLARSSSREIIAYDAGTAESQQLKSQQGSQPSLLQSKSSSFTNNSISDPPNPNLYTFAPKYSKMEPQSSSVNSSKSRNSSSSGNANASEYNSNSKLSVNPYGNSEFS